MRKRLQKGNENFQKIVDVTYTRDPTVRERAHNFGLPQLVEQDVQLELGAEVAQSTVAERLERPVGDEGAEQLDVGDEGAQVGVLVGHRPPGLIQKKNTVRESNEPLDPGSRFGTLIDA